MFECMKVAESIYKVVAEPSCKNIPIHMTTVLGRAQIREKNPPCLRRTSQRGRERWQAP